MSKHSGDVVSRGNVSFMHPTGVEPTEGFGKPTVTDGKMIDWSVCETSYLVGATPISGALISLM